MLSAFHVERAVYHRSVGAHRRAARHDAHAFGVLGLEDMPDNVILNIIEKADYNLDVLRTSRRLSNVVPRDAVALYIARKLITCKPVPSNRNGALTFSSLPPGFANLNVHRILEIVVRRREPHMGGMCKAIMRIATDKEDAAHHALLVRAPFFRRIARALPNMAPAVMEAAGDLFEALRPSIVAAIRSERIGVRRLYKDATGEEMRELVDSIGLSPLTSYRDLAGAVVGYIRDHVGLDASRLRAADGTARRHVDAYGPLCFWDTSLVTRGVGLFSPIISSDVARRLDQDPDAQDDALTIPALAWFSADLYWATGRFTTLDHMFTDCRFNGRIGHLDVSSAVSMAYTFAYNRVFNQPLERWDVSSVINTAHMFSGALSFNQPLDAWRLPATQGRNMTSMFEEAVSFNQPLGSWNVSGVTDMTDMFHTALSFNQPLDAWDVGSVVTMDRMFRVTPSFVQPLNTWEPRSLQGPTDTRILLNHDLFGFSALQPLDSFDWLGYGRYSLGRRMRAQIVADVSGLIAPHIAQSSPVVETAYDQDHAVRHAIRVWLEAFTETFARRVW
jgi:hypothetical protein